MLPFFFRRPYLVREQRQNKYASKTARWCLQRRNFRENDASEEEDVFKDEKTKDEDLREEEETDEDEDEDDGKTTPRMD